MDHKDLLEIEGNQAYVVKQAPLDRMVSISQHSFIISTQSIIEIEHGNIFVLIIVNELTGLEVNSIPSYTLSNCAISSEDFKINNFNLFKL